MAKKPLTKEEKIKKLFFKPCKTRHEFHEWIKFFLGLYLPDTTVSRHADTNPLDAAWLIYDICVNKSNPDDIKELLYVAGRGSGKCTVKGTKILTDHGIKNIEDVRVNDKVFTGWSWQPVTQTFDEGIKDGVLLTTNRLTKKGSFNLMGSLKHRIQAFNDETGKIDWTYMKDLKQGQLIYKSAENSLNIDIKSEDYEKGWIVGNITGDGCVSRHDRLISLCSSDPAQLKHYRRLINKFFNIKLYRIRRNSENSLSIYYKDTKFREWYESYIDGELCYFKKLRTLDHSMNFLAGFISGMMETDGSVDSITLANKDLIYQIGQIMTMFGVITSISENRRKSSTTKFIPDYEVTYHECKFNKLPNYLMPIFAKREAFISHKDNQNEQFRYPSILIKSFANHIKNKYEIANGYWKLLPNCNKTHSNIPFSKDLWGAGSKSKESYVYGHKIDSFIELAIKLEEYDWAEYLRFIRNGYYETVNSIEFKQDYFYDLEVAKDHSYWSNGFISHNTLGMGIVEFMVLLHDKRDVVHVGAIISQAKRCYAYINKFMLKPVIRKILEDESVSLDKRILQKMNMEKSVFNFSGEEVTLEVLPCTLKALNGPHVPLVVVDEIDTVNGEGKTAFKEISGMLDSRGDQQALRVGISTRKSRYGLMNQQLENAELENTTVKRWTAFEFSKRCPDTRSGINPTKAYVNQDSMSVITPEQYATRDNKTKSLYIEHEFPGEGCLKCPAAAICWGDAKKQTSQSWMLKPIDDVIKKVKKEGIDWSLAQLMNLKPSVEGIVFKEFDEKVHVKEWNEMWRILTGTEYPGECTHDIFVKKCIQLQLSAYAGVDWGWSNPNTVTIFFVDKKEYIYVVRADGMTYVSQPEWINYIKMKYHKLYKVQLYFPDQADQGAVTEMGKAGLAVCTNAQKGEVNTGVQLIKKFLRTPGNQYPRIFFAKETTKPLIDEMTLYHFKTNAAGEISDQYDSANDHWIDGLRYAMEQLFGKTEFMMGMNAEIDATPITDNRGHYLGNPTAEQFCEINGIRLNDIPQDMSKLGKIVKSSDLDEDTIDDSTSSGFIWSIE